jgi:hypothetical protein
MPFCVNCGYEYVAGTERCPECGRPLVAAAPGHDADASGPFVRVWNAPDAITAMSVKAALEDAGIPTVEEVQRSWAYDGIDLSLRGIYSTFLVPQSHAERAQALIEEYLRAEPVPETAPDETDDDSPPTDC